MTTQTNLMNILRVLYEARDKGRMHPLSPEALAERVGEPWDRIHPEISDLEEREYLYLKRRHIGRSLIITVHITTKGAAIFKKYLHAEPEGKIPKIEVIEAASSSGEYNIAGIRNLMGDAFLPKELERFCQDRPTFRPVLKEFGPRFSFADMIEEVIQYCQRRVLLSELLSEIREFNGPQYYRHFTSIHTDPTSLDGEV